MIPVVWVGGREAFWDQHLVSRLLTAPAFHHINKDPEDGRPLGWITVDGVHSGCVLVVPGRFHTADQIRAWMALHPWCVLIITSDEESTVDLAALELDWARHRLFVMTPRPQTLIAGARPLGEGFPPGTTEVLTSLGDQPRTLDVWFGGQVTHGRRVALRDAMEDLEWDVDASAGFTQGLARHEYLRRLATTKVAPCPAGPATPDSFRLYEALEAGCMPIVDRTCPGYDDDGYWPMLFPDGPPLLFVDDWATELAKSAAVALETWPSCATRAQAWWCGYKAQLGTALYQAIEQASDGDVEVPAPALTVIVTVSPTSDPVRQLHIIEATVASVRDRLPEAPLIIACDGVRPEQEDLRAGYEAMLHTVTSRCCLVWDAVPIVSDQWLHQAGMVKLAMDLVATEAVLLVEQDTPLEGEIPLDELAELVTSGEIDLVRLHHESEVLPAHEHMMLDAGPRWHAGLDRTDHEWAVPVKRTVQWSQRPHVASTGRYRTWLAAYFGAESRTMIEDVMHGVVHNAWLRHGTAGWQQFRLALYAPDGNMRRSHHLDGRAGEPKYPMTFAYDSGETPAGAPHEGTR